MDGHNRRLILFSALSVSGTFALKSVPDLAVILGSLRTTEERGKHYGGVVNFQVDGNCKLSDYSGIPQ